MTVLGVVERRVERLEREQRQQAGANKNADNYQFTVAPTCPPSTSIYFRGGLAWWSAYAFYPAGFYIPSYTVDLADSDKVSVRMQYNSVTYTFTNAYWYAPCLIVISQYEFWPPEDPPPETTPDDALYLYGGIGAPYLQEFETAVDAENALREIIGDRAAYYGGIAAGGLILRNNGNTTGANQYMSVDAINRGRSYLFGGKRYGWELG